MSKNIYVGRHRPPAVKSIRGRQIIVPVALLSSTVAAGMVVRDAGASTLSPEAAAMKNVSNSMAGLSSNGATLAMSRGDSAERASRDTVRASLDAVSALANAVDEDAAVAAKKDADAKAEAKRVAEAKAAAEKKAKAEAARKAREAAQRWVNPFSDYSLTSGYGWRWGRMHPAQDLGAPSGTAVRSMSTGTVIFSGWSNQGYGYMVQIRYWDGTVSWYAHNSRLLVSVGQKVKPGQTVAYSGNSGNSTGPHLHLEIHPKGGAAVVPTTWLAKRGITL